MVSGGKGGHYMMINGSIHQEEITVVNIYAVNIRASKILTNTEIRGEK